MSQEYQIPSTPIVTSPSPPPSEPGEVSDGYFTRSAAKRKSKASTVDDADPEVRARTRSRSPKTLAAHRRRVSGLSEKPSFPAKKSDTIEEEDPHEVEIGQNGHLSPSSAALDPGSYWRAFSRSPSPLGLIPIHRTWRYLVHKHEVPRKMLHVSVGFVALYLYSKGYQASDIHPWLLRALVPIASVDVLRHNVPSVNTVYVKVIGAFMRESEVNDKYNGVIFYLLGAWSVLRFLPKDVGAMSILLLSWCDTAASTVGRAYGRYTPRLRTGKSLAGSAAAAVVGCATAALWWGWIVPTYWGWEDGFMFDGSLAFPFRQQLLPGLATSRLSGTAALGVVSVWTGLVASLSEVVDVFGIDDNLTIPVLSGLGLWAFLKAFG